MPDIDYSQLFAPQSLGMDATQAPATPWAPIQGGTPAPVPNPALAAQGAQLGQLTSRLNGGGGATGQPDFLAFVKALTGLMNPGGIGETEKGNMRPMGLTPQTQWDQMFAPTSAARQAAMTNHPQAPLGDIANAPGYYDAVAGGMRPTAMTQQVGYTPAPAVQRGPGGIPMGDPNKHIQDVFNWFASNMGKHNVGAPAYR